MTWATPPEGCCHFQPLAAVGHQRCTARCEHGTVHLVWDHTVLQLTPAELGQAVALMDQPWLEAGRQLGALRMLIDPDHGIQVWAHRRGILIDRRDLDDLTLLLHKSAKALAAASVATRRIRYVPYPAPGSAWPN